LALNQLLSVIKGSADGERVVKEDPSSQYPRALIVEDEPMIGLGLEAQMRELGFEACDLAADTHQALSHAMDERPNVALIDVNLEGGREGIE
jgi:CheY-like chemotaxis protein